MRQLFFSLALLAMGSLTVSASDFGKEVRWDRQSLIVDGHRVCPVMGEVHYSRIPADEWCHHHRHLRVLEPY